MDIIFETLSGRSIYRSGSLEIETTDLARNVSHLLIFQVGYIWYSTGK
jgi:hypothetical protein